ncbi:mitochondrial proton/calcium exchanger protein-like protein isoform X1 [Tanacetum coccineum]
MAEFSQKWHHGTSRTRSTETSDGLAAIQAQLNNLEREIKKVNEKVYAAQVGCEQCKGPHHTKDCPLKEEEKTLEEAYYTQFDQEQRQSMEETLSKFISESVKRHKENSNLIKDIRSSMYASLISTIVEADSYPIGRMGSSQYAVSIEQNRTLMYETKQTTIPFPSRLNGYYCEEKNGSYGPQFSEAYSEASHINNSIPRKEKDPGSFTLPCFINNVCFDDALADLGASVSVMPLSTYLNLGLGELAHTKLKVKLADRTVKYPKGIAENVLVGIGKFVFPIEFIILDMLEDIKITLRVGEDKIIFKGVKPASSLIKRVYMLSVRKRMELDLEARLMGETLVLNRSLDPFFEDYIELNNLNVPLELRRDQVDDLMPTIKEGEVIEEFRARNDASMVSKVFGYPIDCDYDKKIRIDCAYNLKFSCLIDFAVLEDIDAYRDEGMGDVSEEDKMNGISHSYQKLKGFYEGVLNLGHEYVRDAKMEEWLTRGHISDLAERKEIDNVGVESTIWKSGSVGVLKPQDGCSTQNLAHKAYMENLSSKIPGLVPSCFVVFDLEPLSLSFDFIFMSEIFKSLSCSLDRLCHLAILCLDQHAHTLHHLESLLTIFLDRLDILKEDLVYQSLQKSLSLILEFS